MSVLAGTWLIEAGSAETADAKGTELAIAPLGEVWTLRWSNPVRAGCGIAHGDWLYAARTPPEAEGAALPPVAGAEYDARTGVIVYDTSVSGRWPVLFYHPQDDGRLTVNESGGAPPSGLEGRFVVGYQSQRGGSYEGITQTIRKDGPRYRMTWEKGGTLLYEGVGLNLGPRFAAAWGRPGFDHELVVLARKTTCGETFLGAVRTSIRAERVTSERYRAAPKS